MRVSMASQESPGDDPGTAAAVGAFTGMNMSTAHAEAVPREDVGEPFEAFYRARGDQVYRALTVTLGDPGAGPGSHR